MPYTKVWFLAKFLLITLFEKFIWPKSYVLLIIEDSKLFEIKYDDLENLDETPATRKVDHLFQNYLLHEKSFEMTTERIQVNRVKWFMHNKSILLKDKNMT